jgi:CRP/FNR family transcriptional regulator
MLEALPDNIPILNEAADDFRKELKQHANRITLPADTTVCQQGNICEHLPIILNGRARVFKISETGKEITLYRIEEGESCVLTASCIMSDISFPAIAVTERPSDALIVPAAKVTHWLEDFPVWRQFIFKMVSLRLSSILTVIEEVAFQRMDNRLANYLLNAAGQDSQIQTTHQQIADELGTAREVITRLLKDLEADGKLTLQRGLISLIDKQALSSMIRNN